MSRELRLGNWSSLKTNPATRQTDPFARTGKRVFLCYIFQMQLNVNSYRNTLDITSTASVEIVHAFRTAQNILMPFRRQPISISTTHSHVVTNWCLRSQFTSRQRVEQLEFLFQHIFCRCIGLCAVACGVSSSCIGRPIERHDRHLKTQTPP